MGEMVLKDILIDKIYGNKRDYIECNLEELITAYNLKPSESKALKRWLETDEESEKIRTIRDKIKLLLYNNKQIPIDTTEKNKIDNQILSSKPKKAKYIKIKKE
jgi:hypothetical protein